MKEIPKMMQEGLEKMKRMLMGMSGYHWHLLVLSVVLLQSCSVIEIHFFFLGKQIGCLRRGFQPNDGNQLPHGGCHLSPYYSLFFL